MEVAKRLKSMSEQVAQLLDGRWMLKRLMLWSHQGVLPQRGFLTRLKTLEKAKQNQW
jgi:hypothetical protein